MVFTPAEQVIPAKARVGPDDDRDLRPALPNPADDPFQFLHRSRGPIDIGTPQPGAQQMLPREDVQREITVVAVVSVKEPAFLLAMDRVVGRIQIQHDLLGRRFVGLHEGIAPSSRRSGPGPSRSSCTAPAHRPRRRSTPTGSAYTCPPAPSPDLRPAVERIGLIHRHRQHRIGAQLIMIVQILVPQTGP